MAEELQVTELQPAEVSSDDPGTLLIALGREHGHVTGEQIAAAVEEVELGPDAVRELHSQLVDAGIEVVLGRDGDGEPEEDPADTPQIVAPDLTVEPGVDSLRLYLHAIGRVQLLTADQEAALAKRIERGDMDAKRQMVEANLRLVVSIAKG
ncbi:MAG: sigma-70 factor domain-containing protein [Gaiellales bacterium]